MSLEQTAKLMVDVAGLGTYRTIPFPEDRKAIDIGDYYGDFRSIRARIGWRAKTSFQQGVARTLEFFSQYGEQYSDAICSDKKISDIIRCSEKIRELSRGLAKHNSDENESDNKQFVATIHPETAISRG
jgi:hypothetical protein